VFFLLCVRVFVLVLYQRKPFGENKHINNTNTNTKEGFQTGPPFASRFCRGFGAKKVTEKPGCNTKVPQRVSYFLSFPFHSNFLSFQFAFRRALLGWVYMVEPFALLCLCRLYSEEHTQHTQHYTRRSRSTFAEFWGGPKSERGYPYNYIGGHQCEFFLHFFFFKGPLRKGSTSL